MEESCGTSASGIGHSAWSIDGQMNKTLLPTASAWTHGFERSWPGIGMMQICSKSYELA